MIGYRCQRTEWCPGESLLVFEGMFKPWGGGDPFARYQCPECKASYPEPVLIEMAS